MHWFNWCLIYYFFSFAVVFQQSWLYWTYWGTLRLSSRTSWTPRTEGQINHLLSFSSSSLTFTILLDALLCCCHREVMFTASFLCPLLYLLSETDWLPNKHSGWDGKQAKQEMKHLPLPLLITGYHQIIAAPSASLKPLLENMLP